MSAVETKWFTKGGKNLVEQDTGWGSGAIINLMLMQVGYVFDQDGPEGYADVSPYEAVGTAYGVGGNEITTPTVVLDLPSNEIRLMGNPVEWPTSTISAQGAIIYSMAVGLGGHTAKPVFGYVDFGAVKSSENGLFRVEWPATGVLRLKAL